MKQNHSIRVGIVADDLTSATDGASPFLAKGYAPLILRDPGDLDGEGIVSIDTNSRALSPEQASKAIAKAISTLDHATTLFKTIDSTLRGHIREEIAAAFRASGRDRLVVAPAFPDAGRVTIGGVQQVDGIPVSESVYGRDPVHPARRPRISDLISPSLGRPVILAQDTSDEEIPAAPEANIIILDADSQRGLDRQVARIPEPSNVLWVGSPGLAIALAALLPNANAEYCVKAGAGKRVLIVAGSGNPVTHAQCDTLQTHGVAVVSKYADAPATNHILCLRAPPQRQSGSGAVLKNLIEQAIEVLAQGGYDTVIATGGETMTAILDRLGVTRFILTHELEPGFPVGRVAMAGGFPLTIAMKAGGFGSPATLLSAACALSMQKFSGKALVDANQ